MLAEYNFSNAPLSTRKVVENKVDNILSENLHSPGGKV